MSSHGFLCSSGLYEVMGVIIERPGIGPPAVLKKDGSPKQRLSPHEKWAMDTFWDAIEAGTQEQYRAGGGCTQF